MIAATSPTRQPHAAVTPISGSIGEPIRKIARWQQLQADAITDPAELLTVLGLDMALLPAAQQATQLFPLRVPRGFVARMRHGDPGDPLLRQILPIGAETVETPGYVADPVGDMASRVTPGLLHKYEGRALVIATGACGVHCRYCFRRHYPYGEEHAQGERWRLALDYLRTETSLDEVILSGGDPLSLSDRRLAEMATDIGRVPHIKRLRLHTRQPIVLPERVDDSFCAWLREVPLQKVMVLHINHANEIDASVRAACDKLTACGVTLLNQSVLLAGVNDSVESLAALSRALFDARVLPYYLNLLDRAQGVAHFDVSADRGRELIHGLSACLPGYLVPKLVREIAGADFKTPALATGWATGLA
jgi:EF-P beta-lysylation protein EpmB